MAVYRENGKAEYKDCVFDIFERNGSWDSDFYARVWDEESRSVKDVEYDTTRFGGGGYADIDATDEVIHKVYRYYRNQARDFFDTVENVKRAKTIHVGDAAIVIKGRKIPKGTEGTIFWIGSTYNFYKHRNEDRIGLQIGNERMFLPIEYIIPKDWETRLIHGSKRKQIIRSMAIRKMPGWAIKHLTTLNKGVNNKG